jgi:HEAT repeat protein
MRCLPVTSACAALLALTPAAVRATGDDSSLGTLKVKFNQDGVCGLTLNDRNVPVFDRHEISVRYLEGPNDGTGKEVHPPNEERKIISHRFDESTKTHHLAYPWGKARLSYTPGPGRIDAKITLTNTGKKMIFSGNVHLLSFAIPAAAYVGRQRHNISGVGQSISTWDQGSISICTLDTAEPLWVEMGRDTRILREAKLSAETHAGVAARVKFGGYGMPYDEQYMIRPVAPGARDTYRVSIRFGAAGADVFAAAQDLYDAFRKAHPPLLKWPDRRPIGSLFINDKPLTTETIAKRFKQWQEKGPESIPAPPVDAAYREQMVKTFERNIGGCKHMDAQAMIVWNMEGNTYPHATTYIGDPRLLRVFHPHFDAIADELFAMVAKAGILPAICIRPSQITYEEKDGIPSVAQRYGPAKDPVTQLVKKIRYARKRWGLRVFYIDTNIFWRVRKGRIDKKTGKPAFASGVMQAAHWKALLEQFPDTLFIPEFAGAPESFAYAFDYQEYDMGFRGTSGRVRRIYPKACSMAVIEDASPFELFDVMVQNVRDGDILRTFSYGINCNVKMIRNIYREAELLDHGCPREVASVKDNETKLLTLLAGGEDATRYHAARTLSTAASAKSVDPLIKTASGTESSWNTRRAALIALATLKEKAAPKLPDLIKLLDSETLASFAARTIGAIGPSALPTVMKMAKESKGHRRTALVEVMGFIGDPGAVPLLESMGAPRTHGSTTAYKALARIGDRTAVESLGRLIVTEGMPIYQRGAVATALGETANPAALEALKRARDYMASKKRAGDGIDWGNFNWRIGNAERHLKGTLMKKSAVGKGS